MISIDIAKVRAIQAKFKDNIATQREEALESLERIDITAYNDDEINYLVDVVKFFSIPNALIFEPKEIKKQINKIGCVPTDRDNVSLKKAILSALDYTSKRNSFYPEYFYELGIKACIYCNSSLTVSSCEIKPRSKKYRARFDVDHYHNKDKYPFLSISLFNLYPACAPCNRAKKISNVFFELYTDDLTKTLKSDFEFQFDLGSEATYLATKNHLDLKFTFKEPSLPKTGDFKTFSDVFHIQELYETQKDIVEELVSKSKIYNVEYRKKLRESFDKLNLNDKLFERAILGNYTDEIDLHKRPLAKFTQDIARELGIIPKI